MTVARMAVLGLVLFLAGCAHAPAPPVVTIAKPVIAKPDSASLKRCADPVTLPAGELTQEQIETYWGVDRDHLGECGSGKRLLINFVNTRDTGLTGSAPQASTPSSGKKG